MPSHHNAGTHPFFMPSHHNAGTHPFFKTSQHKTGTHPFYIGMYIHIYTHIYVHKYTSQKECLHIFHKVYGTEKPRVAGLAKKHSLRASDNKECSS